MKRFGILLIALAFFFSLTHAQSDGYIKTVVIDAGHGGKDPGASGPNSTEKHIALSIALKAGAYIKKNLPDVNVIYTRKTDIFIPLHQRARIANNAKADLFISIHCNAFASSKIYGAETYVLGLHATDENLEVAKKENASILQEEDYMENYEGFDPNSPEAYIIFSLYQNANLDQSLDIASRVQKQFKERVGLRDRGVIPAGFIVLYQATMPGILIETGYLTNANDEKFLLSKNGQTYIASAIYRAFKEYKTAYEKNAKSLVNEQTKSVEVKKKAPDIIFRVQVASSNRDLNVKRKFKGMGEVFVYKHNGLNKYCLGETRSFEESNSLKNTLRNLKFKDAFVVAFFEGKRIPLEEAKEMLKN